VARWGTTQHYRGNVKEENMITTATDEQWQEIEKLKNQTIEDLTKQANDEEIRSVVKEMWKRKRREPKAVLIADCPLSSAIWLSWFPRISNSQSSTQLNINTDEQLVSQLDSQLYKQLEEQLRSQLYKQLGEQLRSELPLQLPSQLRLHKGFKLGFGLDKRLDKQIWRELNLQLNKQLKTQLDSPLCKRLTSEVYAHPVRQVQSQLWSKLHDQLITQLRTQLSVDVLEQLNTYLWYQPWFARYEGGKILGVKFDEDKYQLLLRWTKCVQVIYANSNFPIVSRWPEEIHWKEKRLHNESGPSVRFRSGYSLWAIDGITADEQIVMRPETQTVEQMEKEENQDVRAIRIARFGWVRYIKESGATCIDKRKNEVEGTKEALFKCKDESTRLVVTCPTKRIFSLGVPPEVKTCQQAQTWLAGEQLNIIGAT
jgi:hypothetical protein